MNWKFWGKKPAEKTETANSKLHKPTDIHSTIGKYMVVNLKYDPDWVWSLKLAAILKEGTKNTFFFRIYDPGDALNKALKIKNYRDLDTIPELVLFDGWYHQKTWEIEINDHCKDKQEHVA